LLEAERGLSAREVEFIESLDEDKRDRDLTERQRDWLEAIWDRVCNS